LCSKVSESVCFVRRVYHVIVRINDDDDDFWVPTAAMRYNTIAGFNVDSKDEHAALSSTRSQKKKLKQKTPVPL